MSGIAAIIHFDGAPADRRDVERMTSAMAYRGPGGIALWQNSQAGLGHCLLHTTAESLDERQPLPNDDSSVILVMDGYLTNWEELRLELRARGIRLRDRTDAELVLRAYEVWGTSCPQHIDGEFAFLIWDVRRREAFCARDHQGLRPLFYHWHNQRLIVASDVAGIVAALPDKPPLNQGYIAELMAEEWYSCRETVWAGIMRVPPAHHMRVGSDRLTLEAYWSLPLEVSVKYACEEDYVAHYRELLFDCVRRSSRSHQPLAFEVSGGLDSSALFCVAHKALDGGQLLAPDIRGYTLKGPSGSKADEISFARAAGDGIGRTICEVPLHMPGLDWFERQAEIDCDFPGYPNGAMSIDLERIAHEDGCRVILNGVGGDQWLDGTTAYYQEQLQARDWNGLVGSLKDDWKELGPRATSQMLALALVSSSLPAPARQLLRTLVREPPAFPFWLSDQARCELARRRTGYERSLKSAGRWHYKETKLNCPFLLLALDLMARQRAHGGMEGRSPMLMRSFMEFSATTPEHLRLQGGLYKIIHRRALKGIVPDIILDRRSKAEFSVTWHALDKALLPWLRERLAGKLPGNLDHKGIRRFLNACERCEVDERPFWKLWAIFGEVILSRISSDAQGKD